MAHNEIEAIKNAEIQFDKTVNDARENANTAIQNAYNLADDLMSKSMESAKNAILKYSDDLKEEEQKIKDAMLNQNSEILAGIRSTADKNMNTAINKILDYLTQE